MGGGVQRDNELTRKCGIFYEKKLFIILTLEGATGDQVITYG